MSQINKRSLTISINGTERYTEVSDVTIQSAESNTDFVTYARAASGGARDYVLHLVLAQDAASGALWDEIWSNSGAEVAVRVRPYGNTTASASQPHFTCTAVISEPDGALLGGEADASATAVQTVEVDWELTAKPVKVTSGS